jgi:hypothetical protein
VTSVREAERLEQPLPYAFRFACEKIA